MSDHGEDSEQITTQTSNEAADNSTVETDENLETRPTEAPVKTEHKEQEAEEATAGNDVENQVKHADEAPVEANVVPAESTSADTADMKQPSSTEEEDTTVNKPDTADKQDEAVEKTDDDGGNIPNSQSTEAHQTEDQQNVVEIDNNEKIADDQGPETTSAEPLNPEAGADSNNDAAVDENVQPLPEKKEDGTEEDSNKTEENVITESNAEENVDVMDETNVNRDVALAESDSVKDEPLKTDENQASSDNVDNSDIPKEETSSPQTPATEEEIKPSSDETEEHGDVSKVTEKITEETVAKPSTPPVQGEEVETKDAGDTGADETKETREPLAESSEVAITPSAGLPNESRPDSKPSHFPTPPPPPNVRDKSAVDGAVSRNLLDPFKEEEQTLPLSLNWTFGFNRHIGCLNLSDSSRNLVMYASSHVAVLLDFENNVQKLLLGHANVITCIDCSADKRWLVSGDKGENSSVIVWDSYTGIPVQSIFDIPGGKGTTAVAMSSSAKYIITLSATNPQIVSVWDWTTSGDYPICSIDLPVDFGVQTKVAFCHNDDEQFATNSDGQVIFFSWSTGELEYHAPYLSDDVFNRIVGTFSHTMYQLDGIRALTGTSQGNIVVWEPERSNKIGLETPAIRKRALKLVRLQERAITTLSFTNGYIITGDVTGAVKFYDSNLDLHSWHSSNTQMGPITSISFKYDPEFNTELLADSNVYPTDATIAGNPFIVRDFLVSTKHAEIFSVHADGSTVDTILQEHDAAVHAIAVSSTKPWICIGSYAGLLKVWNFETKQCLVTRIFEKGNNIQCLTFDALGLEIAIGMTNGSVHVVDALSLTDLVEKPFRYARDAVTHIAFSHNSRFLATADADMATTVFENDNGCGWIYLGRYRAHYKPIRDLSFGVALDTNLPRLLTLGEDRAMVEYDLANSSKDDLRLISIDRIEQSAVPSCIAWYPDVTKESFLLMANDKYKYKLFNTTTKMCRKTLLAPTYGSHLRKMVPLPAGSNNSKTRLLSYVTKYKVGLQLLPLDGNPHKSIAVVAHPSGVSHLSSSHDGKYLFTAGGKDSCVHMWSISTNALEAASSLGGEGLTPFYGLLEGGRDGELFAELENYFYFAQLRSQGLDTTEPREVSTVIPLEQIPFVMRALGFYPSEQEIEDMLNEVKFSEYVETGQYVTEINLGDFIKLYMNHRPAFGLSPDEIDHAFNTLSRLSDDSAGNIGKQQLLNILQRRGEHMTEHELSECLGTLLGVTSEGGTTELDVDPDKDTLGKYLDEILPDEISAPMFAEEILGLPVNE